MSTTTIDIRDARNVLGNFIKTSNNKIFEDNPITFSVSAIKQGSSGWNASRIWPFFDLIATKVLSQASKEEAVTWLDKQLNTPIPADDLAHWTDSIVGYTKSFFDGVINESAEASSSVQVSSDDEAIAEAPVRKTATPQPPAGSTASMKQLLATLTAQVVAEEESKESSHHEIATLRGDLQSLANRIAKEIAALKTSSESSNNSSPINLASLKGVVADVLRDLSPSKEEIEEATEGALELPEIPVKDSFYVPANWHDDVAAFIAADKHGVIGGSSGAGKTYPLKQICAELGRPCKTISANENLDAETLVSQPQIKGGSSCYTDGPLLHAMRHGYVLIVDEGDDIRRGEALIFNDALESRHLTNPYTGEVVKAKEGFCVWFTSNSIGDENGVYNREGFDESLKQRLLKVLAKPLSLDEEVSILCKIKSPSGDVLTKSEAELLVKWAHVARPLHFGINGHDPILKGLPSTRVLVSAAEIWLGFNRQTGATFKPFSKRYKDVRHSLWYAYASDLTSEEVAALKGVNLWIW